MSVGRIKKDIISLTRRRLIANYINILLAPFFIFTPMFLIMYISDIKEFQYEGIIALILSVILFTFGAIFQFGIFVILTNGYTVGGFIMRLKVVKLNDEKLKLWETIKRFLSAWNQVSRFTFYTHTKMNTLGQFYYDKDFNTTIINSNSTIQEISDIEDIEDIEYNYAKEFLLVFTLFFIISSIFNWLFV